MKQTNNALNLLNSSYQAVFKHAYFAGIASSFALAAFAPYAVAAADKTVTSDTTFPSDHSDYNNITVTGAAMTVKSTAASNTTMSYNGNFVATGGADLNVTGNGLYGAIFKGNNPDNGYNQSNMSFNGSNLNISQGKVAVNTADFAGSYINISGATGSNGKKNLDLYTNYSYLNTGAFGKTNPGFGGDASFIYSQLKLGDFSALNAMGNVTFKSGTIIIDAARDTDGTAKRFGEIAAKALIRANDLNLGSTDVATSVMVNAGKAGAIYANNTNIGSNTTITVLSGSKLQIAGRIDQTRVNGDTLGENQAADSKNQYANTRFGEGNLNINSGIIKNSGDLVLGANSVILDNENGYAINYQSSQFNVNQSSGAFTNSGVLYIGEELDNADTNPLDTSSGGTTYTMTGGYIDNKGTINVSANSKLVLKDGRLWNSTGTINLNSGGSLSIDADAYQGTDWLYSVTRGEKIYRLNLNSPQLGQINLSSDNTIELNNGVFLAETSGSRGLGKYILENLSGSQSASTTKWVINDATLQVDANLELTDERISGSGISATHTTYNDAVLATTGELKFHTKEGGYVGEWAGFNKLQGGDVVLYGTGETARTLSSGISPLYIDPNDKPNSDSGDSIDEVPNFSGGTLPEMPALTANALWLLNEDAGAESSINNTKTIAATKSLKAVSDAIIGIGDNVVIELTSEEFVAGVDDNSGAIVREPEKHYVSNNIEIDAGGKLLVSADPWVAHNITTFSGSELAINGGGKNTNTTTFFSTLASLTAENLYIDGALNVDYAGQIEATKEFILGENSVATFDHNSVLKAAKLIIGGNLTLNSSTFDSADTALASGGTVTAANGTVFKGQKTRLADNSTFKIETGAEVTVDSISSISTPDNSNNAAGTVRINDGGTLNINGDGDRRTTDLSANLVLENGSTLNLGKAFDTLGLNYNSQSSTFTLNDDFKQIAVNGESSSTIKIDLSNIGTDELNGIDRLNLTNALLGNNSKAFLELSGVESSGVNVEEDGEGNLIIDVSGNTAGQNNNFTDDTYKNAILTNVNTGSDLAGGYKAVTTASSGTESVQIGNVLKLFGDKNGNLIANAQGQTVGAILKDTSTLDLQSSGKIGDITGSGIISVASGQNVTVVASTSGSTTSKVEGNQLTNNGTLSADVVNVKNLTAQSNSSLNATDITAETTALTNAKVTAANYNATGTFTANNSSEVKITDTLTLEKGMQIEGNAKVVAENVVVQGGDLAVGTETSGDKTGTAGALVANNLSLNGNTLVLDPEFGQKAATAFVKSFAEVSASGSSDIMRIDGSIIVGRNSALGLGGEEADFTKALAAHQDANGSLDKNGIGALAYINQANVALNGNKLIVGAEDVATLKSIASGSDTIYLGQNSGLQVGVKALTQARDKNQLIFSDLDSTDTIKVDGGTLILPANTQSDEISMVFGKDVQLALEKGEVLKVTTDNGAFTGVIDSADDLHGTGDFEMTMNSNARNILSMMSDPTFEYYTAKMRLTQADAEAEGSNITQNLAYDFVRAAGSEGEGAALEQAARLGTLGAGAQIAHQVSQTATNAIMQRAGIDSAAKDANMTEISNSQASVWFNPVYQDFSAENFAADDVGYGADLNLYGVAAGFDYSAGGSVKVGAMVNAGKGDSTGTGVAAGIKNEFDYYGAGLYASVKPTENSTITADVSYTSVQNDLKSASGLKDFGDLTGSTDSSAVSAGIGAEYNIKAGNVNITPHVGARYTRIDLDNYDVKVDGETIAHTESETANVFSVPVGVRLSADITNGDWTIQPSADLTVTSNFGDDSIKSSTQFNQLDGSIDTTTEFVDSVTYGAKAGIHVSNGSFSVGADVGYTKSSNTDELSVGATARLKF